MALKMLAASVALAATSCSPPEDEIVPYVNMPERLVPGEPRFFATALTLAGYAQPIVGTMFEGRPTKLAPNPEHLFGRGGSDAFAQAAVLSLYDPDRSRAVLRAGEIATWDLFLRTIADRIDGWKADGGGDLRILTGNITSPSLRAAIAALLEAYPGAHWHAWEPISRENVFEGTRRAFGRRLEPLYRFDRVSTIISLDGDFLGPGPLQVEYARRFADGRRARHDSTSLTRLHVAEPTMTLTGAAADRRLAIKRGDVMQVARALAHAIDDAALEWETLAADAASFVRAAAKDLQRGGGQGLVVTGEAQPPEVHALTHWVNERLGANKTAVTFVPPAGEGEGPQPGNLAELVDAMNADSVETLLILDANPVYSAPADIGFAEALSRVPTSIRHGVYADETAAACALHLPGLHALEGWGDPRTPDGTVSIAQPLITPLFDGRSPFAVLAALRGEPEKSDRDRLLEHWQASRGKEPDFETWWRETLRAGFMEGSAATPVSPETAALPQDLPEATGEDAVEITFHPSPSLWDGSFANNAWLQELPDPLSKVVWGNSARLSIADAAKLSVSDGDVIAISVGDATVQAPVEVAKGQATGSIALSLGYGRRRAGAIGSLVGVDTYPLRARGGLWRASAEVGVPGVRSVLVRTQTHDSMEGRNIVWRHSLGELAMMAIAKVNEEPPSLYPDWPYPDAAWAMVIDQSVCIGCNACMVACQAENNVPVVGPEEAARGRAMHWLRIDRYFEGPAESPEVLFQPILCMHCEKAPCEPVCPVEASVHDSEGLNVQVYNRCIGTRFCEANCPYKVRRFNFFGYGDGHEFADLDDPLYRAVHNPYVSVRSRGVMEKCTYCVQRISAARREVEKGNRPLHDGELNTACQEACPTKAIVFGDRNDADSLVARLKLQPHNYDLLGELGTRPRTSYLARIRADDAGAAS